MTDFERDLRRTLQRREPPRDLSAGVMVRIGAGPKRAPIFGGLQWRAVLAAAAVVMLLVAGLERYREYERGQLAKRQLMLALQITAQKLAVAQEKVDELSRRRIGNDR